MEGPENGSPKMLDAVIVGTGFAGLYMLHTLRSKLGLSVRAFDAAAGVGGTWYWNRYPGARCDTESFAYCYSFSKELLEEWEWSDRYPMQPEILRYLNHVADRFDLRKDIQFETRILSAHFCMNSGRWLIRTAEGEHFSARFFIGALGWFTAGHVPDLKGLSAFKGKWYHTSAWPHEGVDLTGKRVGLFGTGSTGVQTIPVVARQAEHLTVFQRHPQYSVPARHGPMPKEELNLIKADYEAFWGKVRSSVTAFGFDESATPTFSVSESDREAVYENAWQKGGGFRFMFGTFNDIATDREANETAAQFIRSKIRETVADPDVADKLVPTELYATRPICDTGYYETYNRPNVTLVDIKRSPIQEATADGLRTEDTEYPLDIIIFATGFDAVTGVYSKIDIRGRNGLSLKEKWSEGPNSYLGVATAGFPNMFMVTGPCSPFTNLVPTIETQVEWIADLIGTMEAQGNRLIEASADAENTWVNTCREIGEQTLFPVIGSWIYGANIPGKPRVVMFYMGGLVNYRQTADEIATDGYRGFLTCK